MPYTVSDVERHIKGLSAHQKTVWVAVANSVLKRCLANGGSDTTCAGKAIRQANGVAQQAKRAEVVAQEDGAQILVERRSARAPRPWPAGPDPRPGFAPLELEVRADGAEALVRASNDTVRDSFGTVITVEALHEWAQGYLQHRTVNLQHDWKRVFGKPLRGIDGRPLVGVATSIDFAPQLEIRVRVDDSEARAMLRDGKLRGASVEFVPLFSGMRASIDGEGKPAILYQKLSSEPETTGLALTDRPSVPGADLLALRSDPGASADSPNWDFAVVDPAVWDGRVTDPAQVRALRWFAHHDTATRFVDEAKALRAWKSLESGDFEVPAFASLSREEVRARAEAHFYRHFVKKVGLPGVGYRRE